MIGENSDLISVMEEMQKEIESLREKVHSVNWEERKWEIVRDNLHMLGHTDYGIRTGLPDIYERADTIIKALKEIWDYE